LIPCGPLGTRGSGLTSRTLDNRSHHSTVATWALNTWKTPGSPDPWKPRISGEAVDARGTLRTLDPLDTLRPWSGLCGADGPGVPLGPRGADTSYTLGTRDTLGSRDALRTHWTREPSVTWKTL
jgi:hypothetical protein